MAALSTLGLLSLSLVPPGTRRWRMLLSFATAILFVALTVIYVTNVFTWSIFQQNVTFDLAARYLYRPRVLAGYVVAVTTWVRVAAVVALISFAAALLVRSSLLLRAVDALRTAAPAARSTASSGNGRRLSWVDRPGIADSVVVAATNAARVDGPRAVHQLFSATI